MPSTGLENFTLSLSLLFLLFDIILVLLFELLIVDTFVSFCSRVELTLTISSFNEFSLLLLVLILSAFSDAILEAFIFPYNVYSSRLYLSYELIASLILIKLRKSLKQK